MEQGISRVFQGCLIKKGGLVMYWKNGKTTTFNATFSEDSQEIFETVNSHLRRYSQASLKQIHLLKVNKKFWRENKIKRIFISVNVQNMNLQFQNMKNC